MYVYIKIYKNINIDSFYFSVKASSYIAKALVRIHLFCFALTKTR